MRALDGLRGLAILLVVVPHIVNAGMLGRSPIVVHLSDTLAHGVDLFFLLSGFGLAYPFVMQQRSQKPVMFDTLAYAFNRVYRILPMFYLTIALSYIVVFALMWAGRFSNDAVLFFPVTAYEAVAQLLLLDFRNLPVNPGLWTVAVQFRWYLVFPLFLLLWMKSTRAFMLCIALAWVGFVFTRARSMDLGTLPLFLLGIVAADLVSRRDRLMRFAIVLLPFAIGVAVFWDRYAAVPDSYGFESHFPGQPTSFAWHLVAFLLLLSIVRWQPLRMLFSWSPLVVLGAASFSIYLVHQPILAVMLGLFGTKGGGAAFAGSIAAGLAMWWFIERRIADPELRRALRKRAQPAMARAFAFAGIPASFAVGPKGAPRMAGR